MVRSSDELDILCTSCGRRQAGSPHLCDYCGAPLTPHASTDPVLGIMARGFAARQGITRAKKPIVVLGMWLWLGPLMLMGLVLSSMSLSAMLQAIIDGHWLEASLALLAFAVPVAMVLIPAAILVRIRRRTSVTGAIFAIMLAPVQRTVRTMQPQSRANVLRAAKQCPTL